MFTPSLGVLFFPVLPVATDHFLSACNSSCRADCADFELSDNKHEGEINTFHTRALQGLTKYLAGLQTAHRRPCTLQQRPRLSVQETLCARKCFQYFLPAGFMQRLPELSLTRMPFTKVTPPPSPSPWGKWLGLFPPIHTLQPAPCAHRTLFNATTWISVSQWDRLVHSLPFPPRGANDSSCYWLELNNASSDWPTDLQVNETWEDIVSHLK